MTDQRIIILTVTGRGNGAEVIVSGDDGTGSVDTRETLLVLSRAVATVITKCWDRVHWLETVVTTGALIMAHVREVMNRPDAPRAP